MGATALNPAATPRRGLLPARLLRAAPDEKLVKLVRQGSQPAFEVVYDRHHRGILAFCRHMLGNREEAEDALQHTFMSAYKDLLGSDKDIQLRAWLYTIARNRCLSVLRARREHPSDDIEMVSVEGLATEVQRRDDLREMLQDLASLPEDQREALVLSELGDLGHDEIARILDVPKDKVKALVFQARSSLHQSREARETSCEDIRQMLSTLSGGSLRRTTLRRHIKTCAGCQAFEAEVKRQRRALAVVLPVLPTLGLKESALAAAFGQGAAAGAGAAAAGAGAAAAGTGILTGGGASALVAKALVVATVAGGGAAGVSAVSDSGAPAPRATPATGAGPGGSAPVPAVTAEAGAEQAAKVKEDKPRKNRKARRRGHTDRGKAFAETRGKGKKHGLRGTQPGQTVAAEKKKAAAERARGQQKAAQQKAKARGKAKARSQKPARRPARPQPQPTPRPTAEPKPKPTPEARTAPEPTPAPTP